MGPSGLENTATSLVFPNLNLAIRPSCHGLGHRKRIKHTRVQVMAGRHTIGSSLSIMTGSRSAITLPLLVLIRIRTLQLLLLSSYGTNKTFKHCLMSSPYTTSPTWTCNPLCLTKKLKIMAMALVSAHNLHSLIQSLLPHYYLTARILLQPLNPTSLLIWSGPENSRSPKNRNRLKPICLQ